MKFLAKTKDNDSIQLPPPALDSGNQSNAQNRLNSLRRTESGKSQDVNDRSPLLEPQDRRVGYASVEASPFDDPVTKRDAVKLQPTSDGTAVKTFLAWVDGQVQKVDEFYQSKEKEALKRYLVLQDQMITMDQHRRESKKLLNKADVLNRATGITKFAITKKIDLPSLPENIRRHLKKHHMEEQYNESRDHSHTEAGVASDYTRKIENIPYTVARRRLRIAVTEYYVALELLKGYRSLNITAVRKIVKKFDKATHTHNLQPYMDQVKTREFVQSDLLDNLLSRTEDLFSFYFEDGNHKRAVAKLRAKEIPEYHYSSMFITGLFIGLAIPLFIEAVVNGVHRLNDPRFPDTKYLFQIWGGFFLVGLILVLFTINFGVWTKFRINYPFIFEFDTRDYLDYQQYGEVPAILMFLLCLFGWLSLSDFYHDSFKGRYFPPIFLGIAVLVFVTPLPFFHWKSRKWLLIALSRLVLSGLYPVEFRDFFLGDIFCSLNYSLSNISMFFCLYADHWSDGANGKGISRCSSSRSRSMGFLNCLPGIWRFLQCIRRFGDSGDWFPHLANAAKYSCMILANMFLSLARIDRDYLPYRILYIIFASLNAIYSSFWDVIMDFSLGQPYGKNPGLRNELAFGARWPYYTVMIIDPILRFNWVFYAIFWNQIEQSATVSFFVALSELLRRFLWVFFRVENEHCANVTRARASRDVSLPYAQKISDSPEVHPHEDEEISVGSQREPTHPQEGTPSTLSRRMTFAQIATPVLLAVSSKLRAAHTKDFQRRKPTERDVEDIAKEEQESDDEDEDDDIETEEESIERRSDAV